MTGPVVTVWVRVLAINVECGACGDTQRIDQPQHEDSFTQRILEPLWAWWAAHLLPMIDEVEAIRGDGGPPDDEKEVRGGLDG